MSLIGPPVLRRVGQPSDQMIIRQPVLKVKEWLGRRCRIVTDMALVDPVNAMPNHPHGEQGVCRFRLAD